MTPEKQLSIIIPSYNEQDNIHRTFHRIHTVLQEKGIPFEIIFVSVSHKRKPGPKS